MTPLLKQSVVVAWFALVILTVTSWYLSLDLTVADNDIQRLTSSILLLLAFFKVRLVIMHFMEIGTAPNALRLIFELWVVAVCALLLGMDWLL